MGTLVEDQNLTNAACWFADDMGAKNYFPADHVDSQGRTMSQRLSDFGVGGSKAENIFYTTQGSSAQYAFDAWKGSAGHNTNMLNGNYTRIGIGRAFYNNRYYWVTDFANGTANTVTNQCGAMVTPPPPPPPPPTKKPAPPPPTTIVEPPPTIETTPTTTAATIAATPLATKSASKSAKIVKLTTDAEKKGEVTIVQGIAATTLVLGNLALLAFIAIKLYHHHRFLR